MVARISLERSQQLYRDALKYIPGGLNSRSRFAPPGEHPLYMSRAAGSRLFDVDGNEYLDYLMGFGPIILGYCDPVVNEAVREQLERGSVFGMSNELEIEVAKKLVNDIPCADLAFMSNTGSEANTMAIRLARAFTGKDKIAKFEGVWHGWLDWCLVDSVYQCTGPLLQPHGGSEQSPIPCIGEAGVTTSIVNDYVVLPWNETEAVEKTLRRRANEIAAVIVEPSGPLGTMMPEEGFLEVIRKVTDEMGILLIFDEVKTGFRLSLGGYQQLHGVVPDLSTYAKAMGNGFAVAAVAGRKDIMELTERGIVSHAGTFNGNPISMAASLAVLSELEKPNRYEHLYGLTSKLVKGMSDAIDDTGVEAILVGPGTHKTKPGPMFDIYFTDAHRIRSARDMHTARKDIHIRRRQTFIKEMLTRGIHMTPHVQFISFCHTEEEINSTIQAVEESLNECKKT